MQRVHASNVELICSRQRGKRVPWRRLWPFLGLSLCLHSGLLLAWRTSAPDFARGAQTTVLSIDLLLVEAAPPTSRAREPSPPRPRPPRARVIAKPLTPNPPQAAATPAASVSSVAGASLAPANLPAAPASVAEKPIEPRGTVETTVARESLQAHVEALLLADLARRFEYPVLARRHGWQGLVLLALTVKPNGALEHVHIRESSGYAVLDRSAVDTMRRIEKLTNVEQRLNGRALELLLPIVYRLTD